MLGIRFNFKEFLLSEVAVVARARAEVVAEAGGADPTRDPGVDQGVEAAVTREKNGPETGSPGYYMCGDWGGGCVTSPPDFYRTKPKFSCHEKKQFFVQIVHNCVKTWRNPSFGKSSHFFLEP